MGNGIANTNENIIQLELTKYYNANKSEFSGSAVESELNIEYEYIFASDPRFSFSENIDIGEKVHNNAPTFSITFKKVDVTLYDYQGKRGNQLGIQTYAVIYSGIFELQGPRIQMDIKKAHVEGKSDVHLMDHVFNSQVIPKIQETLLGIPLPQAMLLLGSSIQFKATRLSKSNNILITDLEVEKGSTGMPTLSLDKSSPLMGVALSEDAIQRIFDTISHLPFTETNHSKESYKAWGDYNYTFSSTIKKPEVTLRGNDLHAKITIDRSETIDFKPATYKLFGKSHTVVPGLKPSKEHPSVPDSSVDLNINISKEDNKITSNLSLRDFDFSYKSDLPFPLNKIDEILIHWVIDIVKPLVKSIVTNKLKFYKIVLFNISDQKTDPNAGMDLTFIKADTENDNFVAIVESTS